MNSLLAAAEKYNMLLRGDAVLCALSAGADSTCMTHALARARATLGIQVAAAHFSHGLRPESAENERKMAENLCASLQIELFCGEGDTRAHAQAHGLSLEEAARDLRYAFLRETLASWLQRGAIRTENGKIATAHNLGDQAETVIFNLVRGAGIAGIKGISPVRGELIRPLIETPRDQIEQYLAQNALPFAIDETNASSDYTRNKLRNEIFPLFAGINSRYAENIARAGFFAGQALDFLDEHAKKMLIFSNQSAEIEISALATEHDALCARAVALAFAHVSGGANLYGAHIGAVRALARADSPSAEAHLPKKIVVRREYGKIIFEKSEPQIAAKEARLSLNETVFWHGWRISASENPVDGARKIARGEVDFPITVRPRREGERIITQAGGKSLKKLMIDKKIPKKLRDITPVLCDNMGVLCVAGDVWRADAGTGGTYVYISVGKHREGR